MVKVREDYAVTGDGQVDIERWVRQIESQTHLENAEQFRRACEMAAAIDVQAVREDRVAFSAGSHATYRNRFCW